MKKAFVLFLALFSASLQAQEFELTKINLTVQNGLAGDNVYCALQDDKGYIWFGTETGVSRYNGRSFENFYMRDGLADNEIFRIDQDSRGRIWFSAFNGQISYYHKGRFYNKSNSDLISAIKFKGFYTNMFEDSNGNLWFSTKSRIAMVSINGAVKNSEDFIGAESLRAASFMEKDGIVWGSMGYDRVAYPLNLKRAINKNDVVITRETYSDFIAPHTVFLPAGLSSQPRRYLNTFLNKKNRISKDATKAHNYPEGELWACTFSGAIKVNTEKRSAVTFLEDKQVTHVLKDREGGYWFTTFGDGVFFVPSLEKGAIRMIQDKPIGNTTALYMKENVLWFGANGALIGKVSPEISRRWNLSRDDGRSRVRQIIELKGSESDFFVIEEGILLKNERDEFSRLNGSVKVVQPWSDSLVVAGTTNMIHVFDRDAMLSRFIKEDSNKLSYPITWFKNHPSVANIRSRGSITDMEIYQEGMLISTALGLHFLDTDLSYHRLSGQPIEDYVINDIKVLNDSSYLLATNGLGTFLFKDGLWTKFSEENGMSSDINRKVYAENDSTFWVATNTGVNRIVGNMGDWHISSLRSTDGLLSEDVNDLLIHNEYLFAATSKGISRINVAEWQSPKTPPLVSMNTVLADDLPLSAEGQEVDYSVKNITVKFDGLHFQSLDRMTYQYRMLGLDESWRMTDQNVLSFSNLKPGNYTFQVKAISAFGDESELAETEFNIATPFWLAWWFISLVSLTVVVLLILITQAIIRRNKLKQERKFEFQLRIAEAERKALQSQLNPHFIFNSLNSIQNMVLDEDPDSAYQYLAKFGKLIRRVLEFSDLSMVALNDELETLRLYMDLENLRLNDKFDYDIRIDEDVNLLEVVPSMIMQPHVENAIWHGIMPLKGRKRGQIDITVRKNERGLYFEVQDNGVGRTDPTQQKKNSMGTKIVNELVRKHKGEGSGEVITEDLFNGDQAAGTRVKIRILTEHMAYD